MDARRRLVPVVAFVGIIAALVGLRLASSDEDGGAAGGATEQAPDGTTGGDASLVDTAGVRFTDVTRGSGLDELHSETGLTGESAMTAGVAVADVDGDDDLDIFLTRVGLPNRLLLNDGAGRFRDVSEFAGVAAIGADGGSSAAAFADVDGDGDLDLVTTAAVAGGTTLALNDGTGRFIDATAGSGLDDLPALPDGRFAQMHGVTFADYDRDGRLDLLVTHWDEAVLGALADPAANEIRPDDDGSIVCARADWLAERGFPRSADAAANRGRLYRNEGDGRFADVTETLGLPFDQIMGFTGTFVDVDGDGWDDLLVTGDFCTSRIFRNVEGRNFSDVTATSGVATDENGMGSVIADLDGDGLPDWFVTSIGPVGDEPAPLTLGGFGSSGNRLYLNDGTGAFTDATDRLGLRNGGWGWGAAIEDFTNDGRLSVVMTNGYSVGTEEEGAGTPHDDPMRFWMREGAAFAEVSAQVGLEDTSLGRGLVAFDMDRDGDLDVLVANWGAQPRLYRNDSPARHWITVQLDDPGTPGNRAGVGARVVAMPEDGDPATRWILGGGSYESQVPPEAHFGLGDAPRLARLEVHWPGTTEPQVLSDVDADRVLVVRRS